MHLENFGSYKADNRLIYFDNNDFDEACLAPSLYELVRLLTSVLVGASDLKLSRAEALALCQYAVRVSRSTHNAQGQDPRPKGGRQESAAGQPQGALRGNRVLASVRCQST